MLSRYHILLTVDVEDWFQVENLKSAISFESWPSRELRVEKNTHRLLDLFDEASLKRSAISDQRSAVSGQVFADNDKSSESCKSCPPSPSTRIRATFFVLGWIAERVPHLVREIHSRGHEIASHGLAHRLSYEFEDKDLRNDLKTSKKLLEDIIGSSVFGYRAPSFSVSEGVLPIIGECGYLYDSSYNSFDINKRYGHVSLKRNGGGLAHRLSEGFYELPISNLILKKPFSSKPFDSAPFDKAQGQRKDSKLSDLRRCSGLSAFRSEQSTSRFVLPWGGGAYFRLIPSWVFGKGVNWILEKDNAYLFYIHPWEIDPDQPHVSGISLFYRFRHYFNLKKTYTKLSRLLEKFSHCRFVSCSQYLQEVTGDPTAIESCKK
jgi:hypothetical protein